MKSLGAFRVACAIAVFSLASAAAAQSLIIYPSKGQSPEQQNKDQGECQMWAKNNTGIDPLVLANQASQPTAQPQQNQAVKGAARGAAGGAAIGAIAGDAGKGAAIGAGAGALRGKSKQNQQTQAAQQQQAASQQNTQAQLATYNKAYSACLEGRGYAVK